MSLIDYSDTVDAPRPPTPPRPRVTAGPPKVRWGLLVFLLLTGPLVWTVGPIITFFVVVATALLPMLAFLTVPVAGLVGVTTAAWTTYLLREIGVARARAQHARTRR